MKEAVNYYKKDIPRLEKLIEEIEAGYEYPYKIINNLKITHNEGYEKRGTKEKRKRNIRKLIELIKKDKKVIVRFMDIIK